MDKIALLRKRKEELISSGKAIRAEIEALTDEESFVELAAFSFSGQPLYGDDPQGEGVVTGFATIGGYPFYVVAQNFADNYGGLTKTNCEKIVKTLSAAEKNNTPVVYLLNSRGVRVGEGVDVLEGISELLLKATQLKGTVLQFAVLLGEVYGSTAALDSVFDCVLFTPKASLCLSSPLVLSAKAGKNLKDTEVGGFGALKNAALPAIEVKNVKDAAASILRISDIVKLPVIDAELNESMPALNKKVDGKAVASLLENGVEIGANTCPEVKTVLGRVGGIAVAAVIFDNATLNADNVKKIKSFAELACYYNLPFVTFVDCIGVETTLSANNSVLFKEIGEYLTVLDAIATAKVAVVTGKAIGLGYSLFAAKSAGFDYTLAFATAQISLFESAAGAQIELSGDKRAEKADLAKIYAEENADPVNAAKGGYLDNVIEPQFVKQYLIASLQTLID